MNEQDYTEEYHRRLERTRVRAPEGLRQRISAAIRAEDQPDPTRSKLAWDEDTQSYVRIRVDADPHAIDRGE